MGFANTGNTLVPQMVAKGVLQHKVFAMCFSYDGGVLVLGGNDDRLHREPMKYTSASTSGNSWFRVGIRAVKIGGESIGSTSSFGSGKGTIVDSGTTDTYLPRWVDRDMAHALHPALLTWVSPCLRFLRQVEGSFKSAFKRASGIDYSTGQEYHFSDVELAKLPSVYFEME